MNLLAGARLRVRRSSLSRVSQSCLLQLIGLIRFEQRHRKAVQQPHKQNICYRFWHDPDALALRSERPLPNWTSFTVRNERLRETAPQFRARLQKFTVARRQVSLPQHSAEKSRIPEIAVPNLAAF